MQDLFEQLKSQKKWDEIIFESNKRIQVSPHIGRFHFYQGYAYFQLGQFEEAESALMKAHTLDETQCEAAVMHVQCLDHLHKYRDAMDLVKELMPQMPNENRLRGLFEFLSSRYESTEHDRWEHSRLAGSKIVWAAGHHDKKSDE